MIATKDQIETWLQESGLAAPGNEVLSSEVYNALVKTRKDRVSKILNYITDKNDGSEIHSIPVNTAASRPSLQSSYFNLNSTTTEYYVWFNVDSSGVDPAIAGKTGIEVALVATDDMAQVATKLSNAIDAEADFISFTEDRFGVIIEGAVTGMAIQPSISPGNSDFGVNVISRGGNNNAKRYFGKPTTRTKTVTSTINPHTSGYVERERAVSIDLRTAADAIAVKWTSDDV